MHVKERKKHGCAMCPRCSNFNFCYRLEKECFYLKHIQKKLAFSLVFITLSVLANEAD